MVKHIILWQLKGYAVHPEHVAVATDIVRPKVKNRVCMDYEVN